MFIKDALFSRTSIPLVGKSLDASALRSRAIAGNLANVDTPGYQRIEVAFEAALRLALDGKTPQGAADKAGHLPLGRPGLDRVEAFAYRSQDPTRPGEVNNVDVDIEMAKLAENRILFEYGVKFINLRKADITSAIKGQAG
jgi:flagellar basal-body rod protein FlgB